MKRLFALALALSTAAVAQDSKSEAVCKAARTTCKEGCTLDLGISESTREQVPKCLQQCSQAEVVCLARHVAEHHAQKLKAERQRSGQAEAPPPPLLDPDLPPVRQRITPRPKVQQTQAKDASSAPSR